VRKDVSEAPGGFSGITETSGWVSGGILRPARTAGMDVFYSAKKSHALIEAWPL